VSDPCLKGCSAWRLALEPPFVSALKLENSLSFGKIWKLGLHLVMERANRYPIKPGAVPLFGRHRPEAHDIATSDPDTRPDFSPPSSHVEGLRRTKVDVIPMQGRYLIELIRDLTARSDRFERSRLQR